MFDRINLDSQDAAVFGEGVFRFRKWERSHEQDP